MVMSPRSLLGAAALALALPVMADVVSVKDFGARGDGATNDTAAIQAALDAVAARGGGTVQVPAGTYVVAPSGVATWLRVGSDTTVRGEGEAATVFRVASGAGDYRTIFGQAAGIVRNVRLTGFRVDQNPAGNVKADIRAGQAARHQYAFYFTAFDGVEIEGVAVDPATGVNTFALNGPGTRGGVIRGCRVRFVKGRTTDPSGTYDNSAVYVDGAAFTVTGNRFESGGRPGDAMTGIEIHTGPGGTVSGNLVSGYYVGINAVGAAKALPEVASNDFGIVGNAFTGVASGIQLWALTGRTLRNVTVAGNAISVANATVVANTYGGVTLQNEALSGQALGDFDGIVISGNTVAMAREDRAGYAFSETAGILAAPQGSVRNLIVANNVIRDAPSQGLRVESKTGSVTGLVVQGNVIVDAGNNAAAGPYRIGLVLAGRITGGQVRGNVLVDTGVPLNGLTGIHAAAVAPGSDLQLEGNELSVADPAARLGVAAGQNVFAQRRVTLPYGPVVSPDATRGRSFVVTATNGVPFTVAVATGGVPGQRISIHLKNGAGGPLGGVTWARGYKLAGSFVAPADGFGRIVELEWDGAAWVETGRSGADVPN